MSNPREIIRSLDDRITEFRGTLNGYSLRVRDFDGVLAKALSDASEVLLEMNRYCESILEDDVTQPIGEPLK